MASILANWTCIVSSSRLCRSSQAVSVIGRAAYIFGGEVVPRQPTDNSLDVIEVGAGTDPSVQTISAQDKAPIPRVGSLSTTIRGRLWLFSGRGGLEMKPIEENGALWRYDAKSTQWDLITPADSTAPFPAGRSYHCITSDNRGKIYVHSGCPESGRLSDLWVFNTESRTWAQLPSAPGSARGGASIAFVDDKVYRMNGFDGKTELGGVLDIFDLAANAWKTVSFPTDGIQGPKARSVATLLPAMINGKSHLVTLFGENDPSSLGHAGAGKMLADCWAWDLEQSIWNKLETHGDVPESRGWFDADVVTENDGTNAVIIHGGLNEGNNRLGDVWKLSFA